jgi:hypothetical protein
VHIYWEFAEREIQNGRMTGAPVYIAVGGATQDVAIRLPREIAVQLLTVLSPNPTEESLRVL